MPIILKIAIPCPLRLEFDYILNNSSINYELGSRVRVSFRNKEVIGIIVSEIAEPQYDISKLKPILEFLDPKSLISLELLSLTQWLSHYYHHPIGDCFQTVLPKKIRLGEEAILQTETKWQLTQHKSETKLGKKQQQIIELLTHHPSSLAQTIIYQQLGQCRTSLQSLEDKKLISTTKNIKLPTTETTQKAHSLNKEQQHVIDAVYQAKQTFKPFLLHGITGSGKTEVYIELAEKIISHRQKVLILIPEIGLTTQFVLRFKQRLKAIIVVLNSSISDTDRKQAWLLANQDYADIVIGTRSAVFTPLDNLGLIIIDEEHDHSYKQIEGLKYHARNVALIRAQRAKIPILLGSATPSLESLHHVQQQRYTLLNLTKRATGASLPKVHLVDSAGPKADNGVSSVLYKAMKTQLEQGNQVLLFINRRGFAPVLMCHECNWQANCHQCDARTTVHQRKNTVCCHHCGMIQRLPTHCPKCNHSELKTYGAGTEQIELSLQKYFPEIPVLRIDRDSMQRKNAFKNMITDIRKGGAKILVGTQMLAKGHDFHDVTLVGVLDADQGLFSADFKATEHLAQLITQVTGRAGRGDKTGEVYIQTSQPQHPFWKELIQYDYLNTAKKLLAERTKMGMPPIHYLTLIKAEDQQQHLGMQFLSDVQALLVQDQNEVIVMGPIPAIMEKRAGRFRTQLLLSCASRKPIHQLLDHAVPMISKMKLAKKVRWSIDIDPIDLM